MEDTRKNVARLSGGRGGGEGKKKRKMIYFIFRHASAKVSHNMHIYFPPCCEEYMNFIKNFLLDRRARGRRQRTTRTSIWEYRRLWDAPGMVSKTRISRPSFLRGEKWSELRTMKHDRLTDFSFSQLLPRRQLRSCFDNLRVIFVQPVSILFHL